MHFPKIMGGKQSPFYSSLASTDSESFSEEPKSHVPPVRNRIPTLYLPIIFTGIFLSGILLGQVVNSSIEKHRISNDADPQLSHAESFVPDCRCKREYLTQAPLTHMTVPLKTVVFDEIEPLVAVPNPENQKYWDALVPPGHGFVNVTDPQKYNLEPGITTPSGTDRYSIAMFHQLHCLVGSQLSSTLNHLTCIRDSFATTTSHSWMRQRRAGLKKSVMQCAKASWQIDTRNTASVTLHKAYFATLIRPLSGPRLRQMAEEFMSTGMEYRINARIRI